MGLYQGIFESADGGAYVNLRDNLGTGITSTTISSKQALDVNIASTLSVGVVDESTFTYGTSTFLAGGGVFNSSIVALTSGQSGAFSVTAQRDLRVNLRTSAGVELGNLLTTKIFVQPTDGTNLQGYTAASEAKVDVTSAASFGSATGGTAAANSELSGGIYNASAPTLTNGQQASIQLDVNGNTKTSDINTAALLALMKSALGTPTQVTVTTSTGTLLGSNTARKGWSVQNTYNKTIYVTTGATSSLSGFTVAVIPNQFYESKEGLIYTGALSVIGATGITGSGLAMVTEYT